MDYKDRAQFLLSVKANEFSEFSAIDTFNNNHLEGILCHRSDHRYGALVIFKINDEETEQVIWCTPKLHYPFDKNGEFHWPNVNTSQFYEKLDGTNILSYSYIFKGTTFITFKTRLTPVVKDSGMVSFASMWKELLEENKWIMNSIKMNPNYNLSFEMYGSRNPITIKYDFPLRASLLFGVRKDTASIHPPLELNLPLDASYPKFYNVHSSNLTEVYNSYRKEMSEKNKEDLFIEGMVAYAHVGELSWRMFKCKPEEIEKIHWTASGRIPSISLKTTAINVFESYDNPTIFDFIELLKEEYPTEIINKSDLKIKKIWMESTDHMKFVKSVNEIWVLAKSQGFDITKDKNETMRFMSKHFDKKRIQSVYTVISKLVGKGN